MTRDERNRQRNMHRIVRHIKKELWNGGLSLSVFEELENVRVAIELDMFPSLYYKMQRVIYGQVRKASKISCVITARVVIAMKILGMEEYPQNARVQVALENFPKSTTSAVELSKYLREMLRLDASINVYNIPY